MKTVKTQISELTSDQEILRIDQDKMTYRIDALRDRIESAEARCRRAERRARALGGVLMGVLVLCATLPVISPAVAQGYGTTIQDVMKRIAALEQRTAALETRMTTAEQPAALSGGYGAAGNAVTVSAEVAATSDTDLETAASAAQPEPVAATTDEAN